VVGLLVHRKQNLATNLRLANHIKQIWDTRSVFSCTAISVRPADEVGVVATFSYRPCRRQEAIHLETHLRSALYNRRRREKVSCRHSLYVIISLRVGIANSHRTVGPILEPSHGNSKHDWLSQSCCPSSVARIDSSSLDVALRLFPSEASSRFASGYF
jgi:hypothetical protein